MKSLLKGLYLPFWKGRRDTHVALSGLHLSFTLHFPLAWSSRFSPCGWPAGRLPAPGDKWIRAAAVALGAVELNGMWHLQSAGAEQGVCFEPEPRHWEEAISCSALPCSEASTPSRAQMPRERRRAKVSSVTGAQTGDTWAGLRSPAPCLACHCIWLARCWAPLGTGDATVDQVTLLGNSWTGLGKVQLTAAPRIPQLRDAGSCC